MAGQGDALSQGQEFSSSTWTTANALNRDMPNRGIPVTLLTGFLGAGKTTVLNYILAAPHGRRVAVLINEFGSVDIDSQLVAHGDLATTNEVVLTNGCICCTISNNFVDSVKKVIDRSPQPEYLLIETSGVADPQPVVVNLQETELNDELYLDQVLTVVDVTQFMAAHYSGSKTAVSQIRAADTILLSKCDLVYEDGNEGSIDEVVSRVLKIRPNARILRSEKGRVPVAALFDVGLSMADKEDRCQDALVSEAKAEADCGCDDPSHNHGHKSHLNHLEQDGFTSFSFVSPQSLDLNEFRTRFLGTLPPGVFRSKGLLAFKGYPVRFVFQLSGRRFEIEQDLWPEGTKPSTQLVVIGRNLDTAELHETLKSCLASGEATSDSPRLKVVANESRFS
eukprot:CAMPEP_0198325110 /NCGR_PEP_ID=MMETSP1450-20131203/12925_1 /TAXON_ID=753684 ORGANISM="Madagascaria erythrocladiodes, Strain CCMP3234" /NCGR_SAMPLE_ID=MMETSP1450 /ASSEMBLY_ACC=CAM_ASM_001115 /LENGTH=393 /DNA_ID=CAMNT_0044028957 /DNA_START=108 /DNA_END=1289 /DNA_ORIENTATION=-